MDVERPCPSTADFKKIGLTIRGRLKPATTRDTFLPHPLVVDLLEPGGHPEDGVVESAGGQLGQLGSELDLNRRDHVPVCGRGRLRGFRLLLASTRRLKAAEAKQRKQPDPPGEFVTWLRP